MMSGSLARFQKSAFARFLRRYWWAYPAFVVLKWSAIAALGYSAAALTKEDGVNPQQETTGPPPGDSLNLKINDSLPEFSLPAWEPGNQVATDFSPASLKGQAAFALYFYPMDDTPG